MAVIIGFSASAHAQFLEFLQKAAETTNKIIETKKEVDSYFGNSSSNQSRTPNYSKLGTVTAKRFNSNSVASKTFDVVRTTDGEDKALINGSLYSIYENYSYDIYCSDPKDSRYYKFYVNSGAAYYFNW